MTLVQASRLLAGGGEAARLAVLVRGIISIDSIEP